jgi:hypothetical protein
MQCVAGSNESHSIFYICQTAQVNIKNKNRKKIKEKIAPPSSSSPPPQVIFFFFFFFFIPFDPKSSVT